VVGRFTAKDPVSCYTHLLGVVLSIAALIGLIAHSRENPWLTVGFSIYGASLVLLYSASTIYHWLSLPPRGEDFLKRFDHVAIFVLIAGTYTPICLITLRGGWGYSILGIVWAMALAGAVLKVWSSHLPRWPSTALYIGMGWLAVVAAVPLVRNLSAAGLTWLVAGGVLYTVGGVVYATKRPDPLEGMFGFHEIFHLLVLGGSVSHFVFIARYVLPVA